MYLAKPHIGTDNLINIVRNMREYIISNEERFYSIQKLLILEFTIKKSNQSALKTH